MFRSEIMGSARSLTDYRLHAIKKGFDLAGEEGRIGYWKEARRVLLEIQEALEREEYLKKIAGEIDVALEVLRGDLENIKKGSFPEERAKGKKVQAQEERKKFSLKELVERELLSCVLHNPLIWISLKAGNQCRKIHRGAIPGNCRYCFSTGAAG